MELGKDISRLKPSSFWLLQGIFEASEIKLQISQKERKALVEGSQFRARVKLDEAGFPSGVQVYDITKPKGERYVDFDPGKLSGVGDRVYGVLAMLGTEKFEDLIKWSYLRAKDHPGSVAGKKFNKGRGLQQAAADVLSLTLLSPNDKKFREILERLARRVWKGKLMVTKDQQELNEINGYFRRHGFAEPSAKLISIPPDSLDDLISFLTLN